jgi:hypothetical protein
MIYQNLSHTPPVLILREGGGGGDSSQCSEILNRKESWKKLWQKRKKKMAIFDLKQGRTLNEGFNTQQVAHVGASKKPTGFMGHATASYRPKEMGVLMVDKRSAHLPRGEPDTPSGPIKESLTNLGFMLTQTWFSEKIHGNFCLSWVR